MSMVFHNVVALRVTCDSEYYDEGMQCAIFEHTEALRDRLLGLFDLAAEIKAKESSFYWFDAGDYTPTLIHRGIGDELEARIENEDVVYVPGLALPDHGQPRVDYCAMRVDEQSVKWRMGIKHTSLTWETTWFNREAVINFLSPVRVIVDRWRVKEAVAAAAVLLGG